MGISGYTDAVLSLMLGWVRSITDWIWNMIGSGGSSAGWSFVKWFSGHWKGLVVFLLAAGLFLDWFIWLLRWKRYRLWFGMRQDPAMAEAPVRKAAPRRAEQIEEAETEYDPLFNMKPARKQPDELETALITKRRTSAKPAAEYDPLFDMNPARKQPDELETALITKRRTSANPAAKTSQTQNRKGTGNGINFFE